MTEEPAPTKEPSWYIARRIAVHSPGADEPFWYTDRQIAIRSTEADCEAWPQWHHWRGGFHKAFFRWYVANEEKFSVKLELLKRTDSSFHIGFCNIIRVIIAHLCADEISIQVEWNGVSWDVIRWFEVWPKRVPGGYVCHLCHVFPEDADALRVYPSREELWRLRIFEPFLAWVNDDLANAKAISICGDPPKVGTWAHLVKSAGGETGGEA